jgi:hypothetical protein
VTSSTTGVARLGVFGYLHHLCKGNLMIFTFNFVNNDFAGKNSISLLFEIKANVKITEVILIKRIFTNADVESAPVSLVSLQQGFP